MEDAGHATREEHLPSKKGLATVWQGSLFSPQEMPVNPALAQHLPVLAPLVVEALPYLALIAAFAAIVAVVFILSGVHLRYRGEKHSVGMSPDIPPPTIAEQLAHIEPANDPVMPDIIVQESER